MLIPQVIFCQVGAAHSSIAMAVIKRGLVICMSLHGLYSQHCVFHDNSVPIMSLHVHSF